MFFNSPKFGIESEYSLTLICVMKFLLKDVNAMQIHQIEVLSENLLVWDHMLVCSSWLTLNVWALQVQWKLKLVTLYFKVSLLQCNYTIKYGVILINYRYLL